MLFCRLCERQSVFFFRRAILVVTKKPIDFSYSLLYTIQVCLRIYQSSCCCCLSGLPSTYTVRSTCGSNSPRALCRSLASGSTRTGLNPLCRHTCQPTDSLFARRGHCLSRALSRLCPHIHIHLHFHLHTLSHKRALSIMPIQSTSPGRFRAQGLRIPRLPFFRLLHLCRPSICVEISLKHRPV